MKRTVEIFLAIALLAGTAFSQGVNLCGRVTDPGGNPLTNTLVRLGQTRFSTAWGNQPYYTTTDANGQYKLGTGTCTVPVIKENNVIRTDAFSRPMYLGGQVLFSLPQDNIQVAMGLYDLTGRFVKGLVNSRLAKGNYAVTIDTRSISSQFYALRVTINGATSVFKLQPFSRIIGKNVAQNSFEFQTRLEKLAAVVDTLHATEPGYTLGVTPIEALAGQYDFTLTKNHTFNGDTNAFWDTAHAKKEVGHFWYTVLNRTNGAFPDSMIYLAIGDGGTPWRLSDQNTVDFSNSASGRLYIMVGYKPTNPPGWRPQDSTHVWDFEEHTNGGGKFHGNTTRVDAFGTPIAYRLHCMDGFDTSRGELPHVFYQTRQSFFAEYKNEVPGEFTHLATIKGQARIVNPGGGQFGNGGIYANYWGSYSGNPFTTGMDPKGSSEACRHLVGGTDAQELDWHTHYKATPNNFYGYFLHRRAFDFKCYGYPYDDYMNWSSYISTDYHSSVSWLILAVGY
jgi:hypothetical protein